MLKEVTRKKNIFFSIYIYSIYNRYIMIFVKESLEKAYTAENIKQTDRYECLNLPRKHFSFPLCI